jgi:hypothetical protein
VRSNAPGYFLSIPSSLVLINAIHLPGCSNSNVAIARKLLAAVWHILQKEVADRHADEKSIATSMFKLVYEIGVKNFLEGKSAKVFTREQLDRLGIGSELSVIPWGTKTVKLPPLG